MTYNLALPQPMLAPTDEEIRAREHVAQQFGKPLGRKRLAQLRKMGKQKPAPQKPDAVIEAKRAEIEQLQRSLAEEGIL
jgi:hypothetical protein